MVNILGPVYHHHTDGDAYHYTTFLWPLLEWQQEDGGSYFSFLKLYQLSRKDDYADLDLLLGLGEIVGDDEGHNWRAWPLVSYEARPVYSDGLYPYSILRLKNTADHDVFSLLGPLIVSWQSRLRDDGTDSFDLDFLLAGEIAGDARGRNWRFWPLISYERLPAYSDDGYPATVLRLKNTDTHDAYALLGPYGFSWEARHEEDSSSGGWQALLLFYDKYYEAHSFDRVPLSPEHQMQQLAYSRESSRLFWYSETERFRVWPEGLFSEEELKTLADWSRRWNPDRGPVACLAMRNLLARHGVVLHSLDPEVLQEALLDLADAQSTITETMNCGVPLISRYTRSGEQIDWKVLFGAFSYKRQDQRSHTSVLRYLYRRERQGDRITRDLFPFLQWDSRPDSRRFSFLWRLFAWEKQDDQHSGHLLFIPWGQPADEE